MYAVGEMMVGGPFSNILVGVKNARLGILAKLVLLIAIVGNKYLPPADSTRPGSGFLSSTTVLYTPCDMASLPYVAGVLL